MTVQQMPKKTKWQTQKSKPCTNKYFSGLNNWKLYYQQAHKQPKQKIIIYNYNYNICSHLFHYKLVLKVQKEKNKAKKKEKNDN